MRTLVDIRNSPACAGVVAALTILLAANHARADDAQTAPKKAPANYELLEQGKAGAYFIPNAAKAKYDGLLKRFADLKARIEETRIDEPAARREIDQLQAEIDDALRQINKARLFVPAAMARTRTETSTIPLAAGELLLVGDWVTRTQIGDVEIRGGAGPEVRCVVEKTVLVGESLDRDDGKGQDAAADLDAIKLVARRCSGKEAFGFYKDAANRPDLKPHYDAFPLKPFIEQEFTTVALTGLTHDQGNRAIRIDVRNEIGHGIVGGTMRRQAKLTLFVPKCQGVGVWGAEDGLRVQSLNCSLMVLGMGNVGFGKRNEIVGLGGSLFASSIPFRKIQGVQGDVTILDTAILDRGIGGHSEGCRFEDIQGSLRARFCRVDLSLRAIGGRVDVENDFGRTVWRADRPIAATDHRIVSQSGAIDVRFAPDALGELKLTLATECGNLRDRPRGSGRFMTHMVTGIASNLSDSVARSWLGWVTGDPDPERFVSSEGFTMMDRLAAALPGRPRPPGVDIISRAGVITFEPIATEGR